MKHKFVDPRQMNCKPKEILGYMETDYGVRMTYKKAWRAKEKALGLLYGTDTESYAFLPTLKYMIETINPGSVLELTADREHRFINFFMSLSPFIRGWKFCRPIIIIDATFLKNYHRGTLFTAVAMDANEQCFPLAFGVGDSESNESWLNFLSTLKAAIGERPRQVIVSDRNNGICNAVAKVFPNSAHGYCAHHLLGNVKNNFKGLTKSFNWKFYGAAKAYTRMEFEKYMRMIDRENIEIRQYLENEVGHEKWARCYITNTRYSIMTSNNAESMNAMDSKARDFPISKLIDWLRERMQKWFYDRRELATASTKVLTPKFQKRMDDSHALSTLMLVRSILM